MLLDDSTHPEPGQYVKVLRGRDQGQYAIIIEIINDRFVYIANGDKRKFDKPKKKNLQHLQLMKARSSEVIDSLQQSGRVSNGKLRFAIQRIMESVQAKAQEKGE